MTKILLLLFLINFSVFAKVLHVGVILEHHSESSKVTLDILKEELSKNFAGTEFQPQISETFYLTDHNIQEGVNKLNANSKIDSIFILSCAPLENIKNLKSDKFYSVPLGFGSKGKNISRNINYVYSNLDLNDLLSPFKELSGVNEIDVLISNMDTNNLKLLEQKTSIPGVKINVMRSSKENLFNASNRGVPSFLIDFNEELDPYAYSGLTLDKELRKRLRAASLNYMFFKTKKDMGQIVEVNEPRKDIYLNAPVASKIGLYPNLIFLQEISHLNESRLKYPILTLKTAVDRALNENLDLLQIKQNVFTSYYSSKVANSKRLPQLTANMNYNALDDRSPTFIQGAATNSVTSYLQLSQVIFSDQINASVFIEKLALDSSRKAYEQEQLNTIYYVASTYVYLLQLNAQLEIQMSNYSLLRETLDVAKINYNVGAGGLQDVYRLQSDVAGALSNISNVKGEIRSQEIYLNSLLNYPKDNRYSYENINNIENYFLLSNNLGKNFSFGSEKSKKIENFLVKETILNSNALQQLDNTIKSKEREYTANSRERYLPTVKAFGNYNKNNIVTPWGKNSNRNFPDEYWEAGVGVSLPIISGGEIHYNAQKIESELKSLEYNKLSLTNNLTKEVLQVYTELLTNYVQSYTTQISSDVAKKNLDIVKNLYAEGSISITDFLSAQNNALSQELNHVIENFNLINSTLKLENLYGKSSITLSDPEKQHLLLKLQKEIEN
ncbi:TolC family protein [Cetobacterium sp. ZWU0022]|uniref:TolC family protein n=1 Tax=Cetobacterium sp. ZWU0022 TaxID=1340502 RepID=UPI000647FC51|nr:TolC family protein [Cetobacterium sp. ZWU0022]